MSRLRDALVARVRGDHAESGVALLSAIIFMVIMAGISVTLLSTVLGQVVPSTLAQRNTKTIYAAQAGVQASLAMLRSGAKTDASGTFGDPSKLVCSLTGRVDAQNNGLSYKADISYFTIDPTKTVAPTAMGCTAAGVSGQPKYAKIDSQGIADPVPGVSSTPTGSRSLSALYTFKVTNVNIPGGRIFDGANNYCFEATGTTVGSKIKFTSKGNCIKAREAMQLWIYDDDYEIKLASTTVAGSTPLCITGPVKKNDKDTQDATLTKCVVKQWNQLWSWMGSYTWQGQNYDITTGYSSYYLAGSFAEGNYLRVNAGGANGTFNPTPEVGPGAASVNTKQIVNYLEFGRCLDVTNEQITSAFMISYPCKQDPSGTGTPPGTGQLKWNHKWFYAEPVLPATSAPNQTITVLVNNDPGQTYCLQTPTAASGLIYPNFKSCVGTENLQKWTRINNTGTYADSYLFVDSLGRCLSVGTNPGDLFNTSFSKITVATCDNSFAQKWNAPAASVGGSVSGYQEVYGG
ncbi:MAG: hypothetical protein ABI053_08880 [Lacisediminihabitans sp.]